MIAGPAPAATTPGQGDAAARAADRLVSLQRPDGSWEGEVVWCSMITSQYVIVRHAVGRPRTAEERLGLVRYLESTQRPDGSWGLHPESGGYVFTTALAYVALRLLGLPPDHAAVNLARRWLSAQPGGLLGIPTWGKLWLAVIGLYGWEGVQPIPPEAFALPRWLPFHPRRLYCHTRYIYTAMAYLYGRRFVAAIGPIREDLRAELYAAPYDEIDFAAHRGHVAASDLHVPAGPALRALQALLRAHERSHSLRRRARALEACLTTILFEQRASRHQGLSPVNAMLNCLALFAADPRHPELSPSLDGLEAWRWQDAIGGTRYAGARSQSWDTAWAMHALLAAPPRTRAASEAVAAGSRYLAAAQMADELPDLCASDREPIRGGWCFSDGGHRWPVSDCTAEALTASIAATRAGAAGPALDPERAREAIEFILRRQNGDGGFGTYEARRAPRWLERLNPAEMYLDCMTEGSYVECTASALCALAAFAALEESGHDKRVAAAMAAAVRFLRSAQNADGSFPAAWGIHFTYGIFHAVRGLRAAGVGPGDPAIARAAAWLVDHQRPDGSWGEHHSSGRGRGYVPHPEGQAVMTSWALLALLDAEASPASIDRGALWLRVRQRADGSWPSEAVSGVFFATAMLDYRLYREYFPAWALARHQARSR